jgi:PAS domain S-box-containing protein
VDASEREELTELRDRLAAAEAALAALRDGSIDALMTDDGVVGLRGTGRTYLEFFKSMNEGGLTVDAEFRILHCNPRFADMMKSSVDAMRGKQFLGYLSHGSSAAVREILTDGKAGATEAILSRDDGTTVPVQLSCRQMNLESQRLTCIVLTDITERKQVEETLKRSEQDLREAQHAGHIGSYVFDMQRDAWSCSSVMDEIFGIDVSYPRTLASWSQILHPTEREAMNSYLREINVKHGNFEREYRIQRVNDGATRWVLGVGKIEYDADGMALRMTGIIQDITERKQAETEILRSNSELEQFSYAISHDMRQPLRMISSYMQILKTELADRIVDEQRESFHFAIDGAQRLDGMMQALLDYSRVGRMGQPMDWIESRVLLDEALHFLEPAVAEALAEVCVIGDWPRLYASRDEMTRLLQNLIGNSLKYRVDGRTPVIEVSSNVDGKEWRLTISDNGVGVAPHQIGRLFQVFQRLHTRAKYEGTGVGLALCRKIVVHHGGRIWVESAGENQGCRFLVALPPERVDTSVQSV